MFEHKILSEINIYGEITHVLLERISEARKLGWRIVGFTYNSTLHQHNVLLERRRKTEKRKGRK